MEIINDLANIYNMAYIRLLADEIEFHEILLGLFILNFLIYILCFFVRSMRYGRIH